MVIKMWPTHTTAAEDAAGKPYAKQYNIQNHFL